MLLEDNSLDQAPTSPLCISTPLTKPLHCLTSSTSSVLRNFRHNPMIGGPGVLPSPPFGGLHCEGATNSPGLAACDTDSMSSSSSPSSSAAGDSGIDDSGINSEYSGSSPLKPPLQLAKEKLFTAETASEGAAFFDGPSENVLPKDILLLKCVEVATPAAQLPMTLVADYEHSHGGNVGGGGTIIAHNNNNKNNRKSSISFMDDPFLMELCNDDYNMNTEEFLQENDIDHVLSEWTHEMV